MFSWTEAGIRRVDRCGWPRAAARSLRVRRHVATEAVIRHFDAPESNRSNVDKLEAIGEWTRNSLDECRMRARDPINSAYARHPDQIGQRVFGERARCPPARPNWSWPAYPRSRSLTACGTGSRNDPFARLGQGRDWAGQVPGDRRRSLRERGQSENLDIPWIEVDMTDFVLEREVDLCTCSLRRGQSPRPTAEIGDVLRTVLSSPLPGGYVAFDINTRRKLAEHRQDRPSYRPIQRPLHRLSVAGPTKRKGISAHRQSLRAYADGSWNRLSRRHTEHAPSPFPPRSC